jgi:hypothetical protein
MTIRPVDREHMLVGEVNPIDMTTLRAKLRLQRQEAHGLHLDGSSRLLEWPPAPARVSSNPACA